VNRLTAVGSGFAMLLVASGCASKYAKVEESYALPTTIIMGAITGTGGAKYDVGTGDYNRKIDERIDQIRSTCKMG